MCQFQLMATKTAHLVGFRGHRKLIIICGKFATVSCGIWQTGGKFAAENCGHSLIQTSLRRTVVKTPLLLLMMMVTAVDVISVELSVAFCRPILRRNYITMLLPPPANNTETTAGCRQIPEHRNNNKSSE